LKDYKKVGKQQRNGKRSYEETVQQKKVEFIRIEERIQHVTGG